MATAEPALAPGGGSAGALEGGATGAVGATLADFDVVATAVGLGIAGGEPPVGGGEMMAGEGLSMRGGKGGCSEAGGRD